MAAATLAGRENDRMIGLLIASALLAAPGPGVGVACGLRRLEACESTNQLVWGPGFERALRRFLGRDADDRVSYLYSRGRLIGQVREVLGGPPDAPRSLPGGSRLFTACRAHSCEEKGAVAFAADGHIVAIGVLNYHCGKCARAWLDLFVRGRGTATETARTAIVRWAAAAAGDRADILRRSPEKAVILHRLD
ncbi:MAG TPA: hypothetical protein VGF77_05515 [Allosphingosinicella sp.]|jgi:hypothetical protein